MSFKNCQTSIRFAPTFHARLLLIFAVVLSVGCSNQPETFPVQGVVHFPSGSPVRVGTVELKSRDLGINARGAIDPEGHFTLTTFKENDGAVAGMHDCVVVQFVMTEDLADHRGSTVGVIDPKFNNYATSGLSVEILADQDNIIELEVTGIRGKDPADAKDHGHMPSLGE